MMIMNHTSPRGSTVPVWQELFKGKKPFFSTCPPVHHVKGCSRGFEAKLSPDSPVFAARSSLPHPDRRFYPYPPVIDFSRGDMDTGCTPYRRMLPRICGFHPYTPQGKVAGGSSHSPFPSITDAHKAGRASLLRRPYRPRSCGWHHHCDSVRSSGNGHVTLLVVSIFPSLICLAYEN